MFQPNQSLSSPERIPYSVLLNQVQFHFGGKVTTFKYRNKFFFNENEMKAIQRLYSTKKKWELHIGDRCVFSSTMNVLHIWNFKTTFHALDEPFK